MTMPEHEPDGDQRGTGATRDALERRIVRLEARAAVREVKARLLLAVDDAVTRGGDPAAVREHLIADYRWTATPFGTVDGRDAYVEHVRELGERLSYTMSFVSGPVIDLDADAGEATGTWALWQPLTRGGEPWILMGHTVDRFVRHEARWLLAATAVDVEVLAPWGTDWGAEPVSARWTW